MKLKNKLRLKKKEGNKEKDMQRLKFLNILKEDNNKIEMGNKKST